MLATVMCGTKLHRLHHTKCDNEEDQHNKKTIMSDYTELGKMSTEWTFRVVQGDAWAGFDRDPNKFECC
jgi:fatty-acid desaturase